jgi:hypothetical protein
MKLSLYAWFLLAAAPLLPAQTPPTQVLATLSVKPSIARDQITKVMPEEVRDTVRLYLDGKIQQWYSRGDGKGVVFILNCSSVAEAKALTDKLPLRRENLVDFDFMPLNPLSPLRILLGEPMTK